MRIVLVLALSLVVPLATAGPGLTDALQDDPGEGTDASDSFEAPTLLQIGKASGWLSGTLVPVDDELDVYALYIPARPDERVDLRIVVDPDTPLDVALVVIAPTGHSWTLDDHGAGRAEVFFVPADVEAPAGVWQFGILARTAGNASAPVGFTGLSGIEPLDLNYQMDLACHPHC